MRPDDRKYTKTHEWVKMDGDVAIVGITDFAVNELCSGNEGDLVYCDLPEIGRILEAGDTFGEIESVKAVADLNTPVAGTVLEVNVVIESATSFFDQRREPERSTDIVAKALELVPESQLYRDRLAQRLAASGDLDAAEAILRAGVTLENRQVRAAAWTSLTNFYLLVRDDDSSAVEAYGEAIALAEHLCAPVITSYLHNDAFPASHPLMCGPIGYQGSKSAMRIVAQADVVLALGSRLGPFGTLPQYDMEYWPADAKIIQIDSNARALGLVRPFEVGICGDAKAAAAEILRRLSKPDRKAPVLEGAEARRNEIADQNRRWETELDSLSSAEGSPISPRRCLRELEKALPEAAIVSTDIGNICSVSNSYLRFERPNSFLAAMSFGNCGYAFPTAMGAKVAAPDRPVVAYVGDGAWGMSLTEVMTCVREQISVTAVVFNNGQWGAEKRNQIDFYNNRFLGTNLANPSFAEIARAMGADGIRVDAPDQVGDALRQAAASDRATVLEVMVSQELGDPFRRDALAKPVRLLEKYRDFGAP